VRGGLSRKKATYTATTIAESNLSVKNFSYLPPQLYKGAVAPGLGAAEQARFYISGSQAITEVFPKTAICRWKFTGFPVTINCFRFDAPGNPARNGAISPKNVSEKRDIKIQIFPQCS